MLKLVALSNKPEHFYYKPTIEEADLFANSEGLIVLTACIGGKHGRLIINGEKENSINYLNQAIELDGKLSYKALEDNVFIPIKKYIHIFYILVYISFNLQFIFLIIPTVSTHII